MSGLPGSTVACSVSKLVPRFLLQKVARFFNEFTSLYQSPPPLYLRRANLIVGDVKEDERSKTKDVRQTKSSFEFRVSGFVLKRICVIKPFNNLFIQQLNSV